MASADASSQASIGIFPLCLSQPCALPIAVSTHARLPLSDYQSCMMAPSLDFHVAALPMQEA